MEKISVRSYTPADPEQTGELQVRRFTSKDVFLNVAKKLSFYWGIALFTVFIPVLHFFLTPLFFGLGIYIGMKARKAQFQIYSGSAICPHCKEPIKIKPQTYTEGHTEICQNCVTSVKIIV